MSEKTDEFDQRYHLALQRHLGHLAGGGGATCRALGRTAFAEGFTAGTIVRAHTRALRRLIPIDSRGMVIFERSEAFLAAVLQPLEAGFDALRGGPARERDLTTSLRQANSKLVCARRGLRSEKNQVNAVNAELAKAVVLQRQLFARSRLSQDQLRRMTRRVLLVQEDERKRISRELHDEVAQILSAINVQLAILDETALEGNPALRRRIARSRLALGKALAEVHRFARELRPALLDDLGLVPALRSFIRSRSGAPAIRLKADPDVEVLDSAKRTVLYRVAQEAITNVARHAQAQRVTVRVCKVPAGIQLEVRDDGRGFGVQRVLKSAGGRRLGLVGMRERVEMVGGCLEIESLPSKGSVVRATVPDGEAKRGATS